MPGRSIVQGQRATESRTIRVGQFRREMTLPERLLWRELRGNHLEGFHFRRQQVIDGFIVDFYCHAAALVVEVDGAIHEQQADYDAERDRIIATRGIAFLRFTNEEIKFRMNEVFIKIASTCKERTGT